MATEEKKIEKLITPRARLSWPSLFKPTKMEDSAGDPTYNCQLIFDEAAQKTPEFQKMVAAVKAAAEAHIAEKFKGVKPEGYRNPLRNGEPKGYGPNSIFITAKTKTRPNVVTAADPNVPEEEHNIKAGDYVRCSVNVYPYSNMGNCGIGFGLQNVQKLATGESMGGMRSNPVDDFDPVEAPDAPAAGTKAPSAASLF